MKMLLACTKVEPKLGIFSFNLIRGSSASRIDLGTQKTFFFFFFYQFQTLYKPGVVTKASNFNPGKEGNSEVPGYWARWRSPWAPLHLKITMFSVYCLRKKVGSAHVSLENWHIHSCLPEQWAGPYHLAISRNPWGFKPGTLRVDQKMTQAGASGIDGNGACGPGKERSLWTRPYGSCVHSTLGERWLAVCQKMGKLRGLGPAPSLRTFGCWSKSWS